MAKMRKYNHIGLKISAAAVAACLLSACASQGGSDTGSGAVDTGTYPNLNIKPGVAAQQFSPEEQAATTSKMNSDRAQAIANTSGAAPNDVAELSRVGRTHAKEALHEIEIEMKKKKPVN